MALDAMRGPINEIFTALNDPGIRTRVDVERRNVVDTVPSAPYVESNSADRKDQDNDEEKPLTENPEQDILDLRNYLWTLRTGGVESAATTTPSRPPHRQR